MSRKGRPVEIDKPSPSVLTHGRAKTHSELTLPSRVPRQGVPEPDKPPYRVPSMAEVAQVRGTNGFQVVSTFSGCGGSCLGFEMAGYQIRWASEFVPAAQETYRANHPDVPLDTRDIRQVRPEEILEAIGLHRGELDVLEGSPPCASFSMAGKREKDWGKVKDYSDTRQRTDDLFFEFARILDGLRPKVFVAENVAGLVRGTAKGYFLEILAALKARGYRVRAQLLDAQWLGVPQMRQRIIFVGVREDLGLEPAFPKPLPYRYSVREALPHILQQAVAKDTYEDAALAPARTVLGSTGGRSSSTLSSEPLGMVVAVEEQCGFDGHRFITSEKPMGAIVAGRPVRVLAELRAYRDKRGAFGNDGDITDQPSPSVLGESVGTHWVVEAESDITPYAIGREWDTLAPGEQSSRYFQLVKSPLDGPSPTVTQLGGDNSVASVCHPIERRKFSIAELKRICAFPDDFVLTGTYAQQWERLGRAVPPLMMRAVAETIRDEILCRL